jgi:hypothetical protein
MVTFNDKKQHCCSILTSDKVDVTARCRVNGNNASQFRNASGPFLIVKCDQTVSFNGIKNQRVFYTVSPLPQLHGQDFTFFLNDFLSFFRASVLFHVTKRSV